MGWSCVWSSELVRRGWRFPYSSPGKDSCSFYGHCHVHFQASASASASTSCFESSSVSHLVPNCIQSLPHGSRDLIPCLLLASFNSHSHALTRKSSQAHWWPIVLAHVLPSPQKLPLGFRPALTVTSFRLDASSSEATLDM